MQIVGPDRAPVTLHARKEFGRGACGITEPACSRRQFSVEPLQSNLLQLTNLNRNRESPYA